MAEQPAKTVTLIGLGSSRGHAVVNKHSPLRRLNYFDGKFIRAPDMILEQQALLNQIRLGNSAGGSGVVYGYDCTLGNGDSLRIGAGFAIDPQGRALLLADSIGVGMTELIEKSVTSPVLALRADSATEATGATATNRIGFDDCVVHGGSADFTASDTNQLYLITVNHTEAYCGEEDVYGKLCSEACSTSTDRSYIIEGVEIRALPIDLSQLYKTSAAVALSGAHLQSRVANAYYEQERQLLAAHISANGLNSRIWCLGAEAAGGNGVPIAILGRNGGTTLFLDAWIARRERMEAPPRHFWAYRMAMRPWAVYLAQILQFQCHLRHCLTSSDPEAPCKTLKEYDPCYDTRNVAGEAAQGMRYLLDSLSKVAGQLAEFEADINFNELQNRSSVLEAQYQKLIDASRITVRDRLLIHCGIVEVPSAGYLPVNVSSTITVNEQVRRFFGEGVELRFCVTRADFVPHALEEAQHMERICLLSGLDDPGNKPKVDVLVPDGELQQLETEVIGLGYQSTTTLSSNILSLGWPRKTMVAPDDFTAGFDNRNALLSAAVARSLPPLLGAARGERLDKDGAAFHLAARSSSDAGLRSASRLTLATASANANSVLRLFDDAGSASSNPFSAVSNSLSSGLRLNTNIGVAATTDFTILSPTSAVWVTFKISRDPFALSTGAACEISARFVLVTSSRSGDISDTLVSERSLSGRLLIEKSAPQGTDTKLTARLEANGIWSDIRARNGQSDERVEAVKLNETLTITRRAVAGLPPTVSITLSNPSFFAGLGNIQLIAERIWTSASQSTFRLLLRAQTTEVAITHLSTNVASIERVLLACALTEDNDVLGAGNNWHSYSLEALDSLQQATAEKGFSEAAQQQLFPPPQPVTEELRVLARRDWVLFHRRREKTCAVETGAGAVAVARSYRVYHVHLDAGAEIERLLVALQADVSGTLAGLEPRPVTTVEFSPGIAAVATAHSDVQADWQARVQVTADIQLALIASEGDVLNEGSALANSRLQSLSNVLAPVSELAGDYRTLNLSEVPGSLAGAEVDGVVVYFTRAVAAICHRVYRVLTDSPDLFLTLFEDYLANPAGQSLAAFMKRNGGLALSVSPRFLQGTDTFYGSTDASQLGAAWDVLGDGPVSAVITLAAGQTDAVQQVTRQQASRISQAVGSSIATESVSYRAAPSGVLSGCPKMTALIAATECNDVVVFLATNNELPQVTDQLITLIEEIGLTPEMIGSTSATRASVFTPFRAVDFHRDSDQFETGSRDAFRIAWQSELAGTSPSAIQAVLLAVARSGATDAETKANRQLAREQAVALRGLMGLDHVEVRAATNASTNPNGEPVSFPVDCRALTLLVVGRIGTLGVTTNVTAVAIGQPAASTPSLTLEAASGLRFDDNNAVIRDAAFDATVDRVLASDNPVSTIEVISVDGAADSAAEARANALLGALRDVGAASDNARVTVRAADATERVEIVRSGFVLDRGFVLGS